MSNRGCISADLPTAEPPPRGMVRRTRRGVTLLELLIVLTMIGTITAFALPRVRSAQNNESTRSARREMQASIARAKGAAVQRGCRATVHIRASEDKLWVTACRMVAAVGSTLDTLGGVSFLRSRYGVDMTADGDSVPFGPNSLALNSATITMGFTKGGFTSPLQVTAIGRPIW